MSDIFDIADRYVAEVARLDPTLATMRGIAGDDTAMTDYTPEGFAVRADLDRRTLNAVSEAPITGDSDRIARDVMAERLGLAVEAFEAGEHYRSIRTLGSPFGSTRQVFDQMPKGTDADWEAIAKRLRIVPWALASYRRTIEEAEARGFQAAPRQLAEVARQGEIWGGRTGPGRPFFEVLVSAYDQRPGHSSTLRSDLSAGALAATEAYASAASYLRGLIPLSTAKDACGPERYALTSRTFNGVELDLEETYRWGWEELHRLEAQMESTAARILPGRPMEEVIALLESDPARCFDSRERFLEWLQQVHDEALNELQGKHFDIDERIMRVECIIPPPGGALAAYYSPPSEDFARPGRTWWPIGGMISFPRWRFLTTAYHEGVPGHHLQVGGMRCLSDSLSRFQRMVTLISGHAEGWALYAERLMADLGYLENPDYYLGMLKGQVFRAVRVIIDIGVHLDLAIPQTETFHPGETWDYDLAIAFATERSGNPHEFVESEVVRYLGFPGQAISYKVGERYWLEARDAAKQRLGTAFSLKEFHTRALNLGPMGLGQLKLEMSRL